MTIGLLSDTHSYLDPQVFHYFESCEEIWHAGDIGDRAVTDRLSAFRPLRAVYGNIDDKSLQVMFPEDNRFTVNGVSVFMTHIGGKPPSYNARVKKILLGDTPDVFICGHSHMLLVQRDEQLNNMIFINPGAAGNHGFHRIKTIMRFDITAGKLSQMEVIDLGKRGALPNEKKPVR